MLPLSPTPGVPREQLASPFSPQTFFQELMLTRFPLSATFQHPEHFHTHHLYHSKSFRRNLGLVA